MPVAKGQARTTSTLASLRPVLVIGALGVFAFGVAYRVLSNFPHPGVEPGKPSLWDCVYFSVVTVSSLGYGDLYPVGLSRLLAAIEVLGGLVLIGVLISRLVSAKQEEVLEYLQRANVIHAFDRDLDSFRDAREELADVIREWDSSGQFDLGVLSMRRAHPLYRLNRKLATLVSYAQHTLETNHAANLEGRLDRAAYHIEEGAGVAKRFIKKLEHNRSNWRTRHSRELLSDICAGVDTFRERVLPHTKFAVGSYKDGPPYADIVAAHISELRALL